MTPKYNWKCFLLGLTTTVLVCTNAAAQDTLNLAEAITIGLENNFNIKITRQNLEITKNNNSIGNAGFLPWVNLNAGRRYTLENTNQTFVNNQEQNRDGAKSNSTTADASLHWTVFDGASMFHRKNRLEALEKMGIETYQSVVQNVIALIGQEFYTVALEQIREQLLKENIVLSEDRINIARNKYEFGKASKLEYLQARVDLNRDKSNLMIQQERLAAAKTALNQLLAREVTLDFYVAFDPDLNKDLEFEPLREFLINSNPELASLRSRIRSSTLERKEITGQRAPSIDLNFGYNYARSEAEAGFLLSRRSSGITYGVSAGWTIFDGLNLNRRIQNAQIAVETNQLELELRQQELIGELYSVFLRYKNNIRLHDLERENLSVARENNEIATERYRIGNTSPLELREAQINLLEANIRLFNAAYILKTSEIDLLLLSGQISLD